MFGYIVTDRDQLTEQQRLEYRSYYCGLCQTLYRKFGRVGQMTLNFDMTFLYILLCSLYESEQWTECRRCIPHPLKKREHRLSETANYCADMTVLLAYYNALDDWYDDGNHTRRRLAKALEKSAERVVGTYPRQAKAVTEGIEKINRLEREQIINLDAVANCFGKMMGEVFVRETDVWSEKLHSLGENLGRFIYFMDAYEDAEKDAKHKNYNPLLQLKNNENYEEECKEILEMFLGEAALSFEALPIVENDEILRNILYAGVWTKFYAKRAANNTRQPKENEK